MSRVPAAEAIRATLVVDPASVVALPLRDGRPATPVTIAAGGRTVRRASGGDIAAASSTEG